MLAWSWKEGDFSRRGRNSCYDRESLLKPNRKPSMSKEDIENRLKELFGIKKAVWFPNGVYGDDDTSGHVGNMFQFTQPGTVVLHYL